MKNILTNHINDPMNNPIDSLTIVIPAYNEEAAIDSIIRRCLEAKEEICRRARLNRIDVIVVDDGSRDRTHELASGYQSQITLLQHEKNRGYGAALKTGFNHSQTGLVGFLDADGTCDPRFFSELCIAQNQGNYDVVSGNRIGPDSRMPPVRRLGNAMFSTLLRLLSRKQVKDTASGMRVIKTASLKKLYPLPDGLNFTPAMTSRVVFSPELSLAEVPMPYAERIGKSKLRVLEDGFRFAGSILEMALIYRPLQFFGFFAGCLFLLVFYYLPGLIYDALQPGEIPSDRIYRMLGIITFLVGGITLLGVGLLSQKTSLRLLNCRSGFLPFYDRILKANLPVGIASALLGVGINVEPLREYLHFGKIFYPWTYIALGSVLVLTGIELIAMYVLDFVLNLAIRHRNHDDNAL